MARYTGPVCHLCRYLGEKLMLKGEKCSSPKCPLERRTTPSRGRFQARQRKVSDYGLRLREKQKVRFSYGVLERQFRKFFAEAEKTPGAAGEGLLILLERRLDNVVYRLGFADSRAQARQIIQHGHILVNGHKTDIPSFLIKSGDVIRWREASTKTEYYKALVEKVKGKVIPSWLSLDEEGMTGSASTLPSKDDIEAKFDGKAIVEYYSR
ncbi:MAG: 30S ribosomal protein S4 [Dehalococcoidia bacterium]|nr:30S ribosomal protein S4 [Dehalococcoidia bacterium]